MKRLVSLVLLVLAAAVGRAESTVPHPGWSFKEMGMIPVQSGGRMKPLDTYARELVIFETGSRSYQGWDPVDLLASWLAFPQIWQETPFIQVGREDVRRELNLDEKRTRFSPKELMTNSALGQYASRMQVGDLSQPPQDPNKGPRQDLRQKELQSLIERLGVFRSVVSGAAWLVVPQNAPDAWKSLALEESADGKPKLEEGASGAIKGKFLQMFQAYLQGGDEAAFQKAAAEARATVEGAVPGWTDRDAAKLKAEYLYNRAHPFLYAWILYLCAAIAWGLAFFQTQSTSGKRRRALALMLMLGAFVLQIFGISLRCFVAGRPPVTNMYESVIWVSLGVVVFAWILYWMQRQGIALLVACVLATLGLIAADSAPAVMDPGIHPLVPVLRSNYWLTVHVLTITLGYAAFALTFGLANASLIQYLRQAFALRRGEAGVPQFAARALTLNQLTYRAMGFGTVLLAAGTILGGIWADYSWGRFWGWDPKEVWALIALLCYLVILHGRYAGWVSQFGFAVCTACAFLSVVMAWYGVNFVLGVGLHSYGFSTGGRGTVAAVVAVGLSFIAYVVWMHRRYGSSRS